MNKVKIADVELKNNMSQAFLFRFTHIVTNEKIINIPRKIYPSIYSYKFLCLTIDNKSASNSSKIRYVAPRPAKADSGH